MVDEKIEKEEDKEEKERDETEKTKKDKIDKNDYTAILNLKETLYNEEYGEKFDAIAWRSAAEKYIEKNGNLDGLDVAQFIKCKKDDDKCPGCCEEDHNGKVWEGGYEGDKYVIMGPDGQRIEGKNYAEANEKICKLFAQQAREEGREPTIKSTWHNVPEERQKEEAKIFSKNAINNKLTIGKGWSDDQQFWQDLKSEYLSDKRHTLQDWERMTRKIPDDVLQRTPEEQARNKKLLDADLLKKLRQGVNPNDMATLGVPSPLPTSLDINQANEQIGDKKMQDKNLLEQMRRGVNPNSPEEQAQKANKEQNKQNYKELTPEMKKAIKERATENNK